MTTGGISFTDPLSWAYNSPVLWGVVTVVQILVVTVVLLIGVAFLILFDRKVWAAVASAAIIGASSTLLAHHAFSAEFDANAPVTLKGPITKIEWINPHAWIHMESKAKDGKTEEWMVEGGTPNTLQRNGITRESIQVGTIIAFSGEADKALQPALYGIAVPAVTYLLLWLWHRWRAGI